MFDIQENLKKLPASPGVYIHKDKLGQVIYVGKAISLRNRVRQYFQSSKNMDRKVRAMVGHIAEFEYITCGSEMEAFILECNLIKKYRPKYNVLLRDDKTYPYIKITTASEKYPRVLKTRMIGREGDRYFGPYSDAGAVNQMIDLLNSIYRLKRCSAQKFTKGFRPCLNYHIGQCDGICTGKVDREKYLERVGSALDYLKGRNRKITDYLKENMEKASQKMDYEKAAVYRDYLRAAESLSEKQRVVLKADKDMDVVLSAGDGHVVLFFIRGGKLTGRETYEMARGPGDSSRDVIGAFLKLHYGEQAGGPSEILLKELPEETGMTGEYLSDLWGRKVIITAPQKGEKKALLDMADKDVKEMTKTIDAREKNRQERETALGSQMHDVLSVYGDRGRYDGQKYRVEAYDISNTNGVDTVGAMVVFTGSKPDKKSYRRFKVRTAAASDDYGSMQEVLERRLKRAEAGDPGFSTMPDAFLIDGGRGHVAAARAVMDEMNIEIPVFGMAKDDSHRTRALVWERNGRFYEEELRRFPLLFKYIGTIQEEVHRFAIDYHRGLRDKGKLRSVLDEIPGVGPVKRNALLAELGSVENIRKADVEQLLKADGITEKLAKAIIEYFRC
ncbi:MAG: excinuclease ABC subunit UvrC [Eubacteriaceae bacterium]|nr:excinuclease ABC subunit UvrC [Eubacteriaceae bacterium]